ncbi:MAG: hypothetical protein Q7T50_04910 [Candidatus Magasanikbacteria bacterium]|nr:hypothetical protein [Candidatus Magasanikbacteria bacterium]
MKKPFKTLPALAAIIIFLGIVGYLNFYKPQKLPAKTTATASPTQETIANPSQISGISEKEAIEKIRQLPEVKNYLAKVPGAHVEVNSFEKETGAYLVQVFEVKDNHTATFGWWEVEKISGKLKKSI